MPTGRALILSGEPVPWATRMWREAQTLREAGWDVSVICPMGDEDDRAAHSGASGGMHEVLDGVRIDRFPCTLAKDGVLAYAKEYVPMWFHMARLSWRAHRTRGFDVIQLCNPPDFFFAHMALFRMLGKGTVFDLQDLYPEMVGFRFKGLSGRIAHKVALICERLSFKSAHAVICCNQSYRQIAERRGGVTPDHSFIVRNAGWVCDFPPVEPDPALKAGFPYMACFLGCMGAEDGVDVMVESIRHIVFDLGRRDIRFVLIGDGPFKERAENRAVELGLKAQVTFTGRLPAAEAMGYLTTADVLLSADLDTPLNHQSTMTKVVEYMTVGKPLVSYDLKEAKVSAGESAVYVPCGDVDGFGQAIVDLMDDPQRAQRMGEIGRQRVVNALSWEHQKPQLLAAYTSALGQARGAEKRQTRVERDFAGDLLEPTASASAPAK